MIYVLIFILSYLLGSISGSIFVSKYIFKEDIRSMGSGNAGTTNVFRAYGMKYAVIAFLIDFLKGIIAPLLSYFIDSQYGIYVAGCAVVMGHVWPIFHSFKGGKGMATSVAVYAYHNPIIALLQCIGFLLIIFVFKTVSIASIFLTIGALIYVIIIHNNNIPFIIMTLINTIVVIYSHRSNIKRLIDGTEKQTKRLKD